jgi:hypothetical protein
MTRRAEHETLTRIRRSLAEAPTDWKIESDGEQIRLIASPPAGDNCGEADDPFPSTYAVLESRDMPAALFLAYAWGDITFLLDLLDRAAAAFKNRRPAPAGLATATKVDPAKNYASQCAIACGDEKFRKFLARHFDLTGAPDSDETAHLLRHALGIASRSELNAAGQWLALNHEYQQWLKQPMNEGQ